MKDGATKACVGMAAIVAMYGIYSFTHAEADGVIFGTVAAIVGGLAGYTVAMRKVIPPQE